MIADQQDKELINSITGEDRKSRLRSINYMYDEFFPAIKNMVLKNSGTINDAKDIFQDGLTALYHNLLAERFKGNSSLKSYLFSICQNMWYLKLRKKQIEVDLELEQLEREDTPDPMFNPEVITRLLGKLSAECQKLLTAFYFQKTPMVEIMKMFNLNSVQIAKTKKYRCMKSLNRMVEEEGLSMDDFYYST